jgi:hypothetical protein
MPLVATNLAIKSTCSDQKHFITNRVAMEFFLIVTQLATKNF